MEHIFYPSSKKFFYHKYIQRAISFLIVGLIFEVVNIYRGHQPTGFILGILLVSWVLGIVITTITEGFRGERLAIKIGSTSIYGPIKVGRDMPIPSDEIDFEKARKQKRICSARGDQIRFDESLFDPDDVAEIWKTIDRFEEEHRN